MENGVIYKLGERHIQTTIKDGVCAYSKTPVKEYLEAKGPEYIFCKWEEALRLIEKAEKEAFDKPMVEITKEEYWEALECLPPLMWTKCGNGDEFFFMSEFYSGNYTALFMKKGEKYYTAIRICDREKAYAEYKTI